MRILSKNINDTQGGLANFYFPTTKNALIIFVRNPELGKCKTRLAETIGDDKALEIYKHLLSHTAHVSKNITADRFVFYSEIISKNDIWDETIFRKNLQINGDLGEKMEAAFLELFSMGYEKVIIIGSDLFDLEPEHIHSAYQALNSHEVIIGPAQDGGYYLLGLTKMIPSLFRNKSWSTPHLYEETVTELKENNIKFATLETLNDIDTYDDLIASNYYKNLNNQ